MIMKKPLLIFVYIVALFALFPIIRYFYFVEVQPTIADTKLFIAIRVYLSSPLLFISGLVLLLTSGKIIDKVIGWIFILIGTFWFFILIRAMLDESGVI